MESDIMPLHSSSPPPLDDDDGEVGSEEDEFGEFGGFSDGVSCSPPGFADSTEPPSRLRQPSPTIKAATRQPNCSFNHPAEQSQPTSTGNSGSSRGQVEAEGLHNNTESSFHLTNGYTERNHNSGTHAASISGACSPKEETGFADFTVFTEQAAHPWCCGFSPIGSTEQWGGGVGGTNSLGEKPCDPGQGIIMDSEPRSHCAYKARENGCTKVKHCEKRDAALVQSSQDHCQSQEAATAFDYPSRSGDEELGKTADSQRERRHQLTSELQDYRESEEDGEDRENSVSTVPQTVSEYESAAEDLGSFCDDVSFECPSEDLEPNVSSLASPEDQTDWDQTDVEEEELGDYRHSHSFVNLRPSQSEAEKGFHYCDQSATQETSATSNQSRATYTDGEFADFKDGSFEHQSDSDHAQTVDAGVLSLGSLPPSDSFADFCSAPTQEDGDGSWAEFKEQKAQEDGKTWTQFREQVSSLQTDEDTEEQDRMGQDEGFKRKSCQASLSCRVQQLLQASFPEVVVPAVEGEEEVSSLGALLQPHLPESDGEKIPEPCPRAQWAQLGLRWPYQDVHSAIGLKFQWGGSHTNRTLLRCLGVDTRNVVFIGMKKQPVAVPAFASSLGMLEPTKDSVPAVCSPRHTVVTAQAPPGPPDKPDPSTESMQEALPSRQLDWSRRGLSSSQDGCCALNLDYFGPEEESRSSSSRSDTPPPGVDRELYELTISKLETSGNSSCLEDTLNRLLSTAEKTSTSVRKPQQDEELSAEAVRLISGLPNLSFMQAKVLMFPSILVPKE
ncbi:aftiphilin isoform X1 [Thunnus albacares]|uniref:aftiphilin isoform X1 n=1 Tax=Thunnus albacares TaxID=8236 RepID=UPI001CF6D513|nr:aftiphilin isoform X1 [Thunnus albacares]